MTAQLPAMAAGGTSTLGSGSRSSSCAASTASTTSTEIDRAPGGRPGEFGTRSPSTRDG
jgi:hypothetical protein